ncbi:MAG: hypothetical protein P8X68_08305 [Desulfobacterales bacterium]
MALHTLNLWEFAIGGTQICLCGFILLFLVRNRSRYKQMIRKAPTDKNAPDFSTAFIVEAVRQQTELAFNHILDTINKERHILEATFELRETPSASGSLKSPSEGLNNALAAQGSAELVGADAIHDEIESLADQGMSLTDISEKLNVPQAEVDLVLKLKRLTAESGNQKASHSFS